MSRSTMCVLAGLGAFLTGCPGPDPGMPDGPDGGDGGMQGLSLVWRSEQDIPTTSDDPSVEEAQLSLRSVRVIGDAASGDAATTKERVRLHWGDDDKPEELRFDQAPPGKYAKIDVVLRGWDGEGDGGEGGSSGSFEISGEVQVGGTLYRYEIQDEAQLSASLPLPNMTMLPPGGELALEVRINLRDVVKNLAFSSVPPREGVIKIDDGTPAVLQAARAALMSALTARRGDGDGGRGDSSDAH